MTLMVVPTYNELFTPLLKVMSDGKVYSAEDLRNGVQALIKLDKPELEELLPSGKKTKFANRVGWAKTSLVKAGLVTQISRGKCQISDIGRKAIKENVTIDLEYLMKYDSFRDYQHNYKVDDIPADNLQFTPDEDFEGALLNINNNLADDILREIRDQSPKFFENLVVDLLERIYGGDFKENCEVTGKSGDEGIDGVIKQDRLGFDNIYIQAKKWDNDVSRPEIQKFAGALQGQNAVNGAFITLSDFSKEARKYVEKINNNTHIVLINGKELAKLMIEYDVGVVDKTVVKIKKVDYDYFHSDEE